MQLAVSCEQVNEFGVKFINVKAVRKSLANFVASQPGWSVTQRAMFLKVMHKLKFFVSCHTCRTLVVIYITYIYVLQLNECVKHMFLTNKLLFLLLIVVFNHQTVNFIVSGCF